ncbi:MAG: heme ABC exporter ATP-binding protein CcmA [Alphaproteobacteria bacterium]
MDVVDLGCDRGDCALFRGVSFSLGPGTILEIHGRNGVGKSSLLRQIAGLLPLAAGRMRWRSGGGAWQEGPPQGHLRLVSHRNAVKPDLTPRDNLVFWARTEAVAPDAALAALEAVGLAHAADRPAHTLSAGQQRRVCLARLLLAPRSLWLLDEPTAALDKASEALVGGLLETHRARGGSAVIATHKVLPVEAQALRLE